MEPDRFNEFVHRMTDLTCSAKNGQSGQARPTEATLLADVSDALRKLVAEDGWLAENLAEPDATHYRQYLLYADPEDRFSVVSFVWGPGQMTPIHDHCTWGAVGMLRGAEISTSYALTDDGIRAGSDTRLEPGDVITLSPLEGDIHLVRNAYSDRASISIHVYGANIGKQSRNAFDPITGQRRQFVSGYSIPRS